VPGKRAPFSVALEEEAAQVLKGGICEKEMSISGKVHSRDFLICFVVLRENIKLIFLADYFLDHVCFPCSKMSPTGYQRCSVFLLD